MARKKYRLTWSKQPNEQGLARVSQATRGAILKVNGIVVGHVYANRVGWSDYRGWYWTACHGNLATDTKDIPVIPLKNTYKTPDNEIEDAKTACEAYVRGVLEACPEPPKA